jgi:hypothetical protein
MVISGQLIANTVMIQTAAIPAMKTMLIFVKLSSGMDGH